MDFEVGTGHRPLYTGDYPPSVIASGALPLRFTPAEQAFLKGSVDFIGDIRTGLDFYTPNGDTYPECTDSFQQDPVTMIDIGRPTASDWNFDAPHATIYGGIKYIAETYNATNILISETGMGVLNETGAGARGRGPHRVVPWRPDCDEAGAGRGPGFKFHGAALMLNFEWTNTMCASGSPTSHTMPLDKALNSGILLSFQVHIYLKGVLTQGNPISPWNFV
ncbi:hypothetical protein GGX14DRAFT_388561 [Mycena pura]|uniref:Uncharacterized protein n=1 Tax=Mycena pura TaxID=153505 RepID=A0AAD6VSB8_9AGAR|nr:hypothetical protein GGX14DRAFT_388561 [Mycena pura]